MISKIDLLTKLNPYMVYLKLGFIAALFLSGVFVGCKMDEPDCSVQDKARTELITENATLRSANAEYARVEGQRNAQAAAQVAAQKKIEEQAKAEVAAAQERAQTLKDKLAAIEAKQAKAAADPKCRDIMEMQVCEALR